MTGWAASKVVLAFVGEVACVAAVHTKNTDGGVWAAHFDLKFLTNFASGWTRDLHFAIVLTGFNIN